MVNTKNMKYFSFENDELLTAKRLEKFNNDHSLARARTIVKVFEKHLVIVKDDIYVIDPETLILYLVKVDSLEKYIAMMSRKYILESYDYNDYDVEDTGSVYELYRMSLTEYEDFSMDIINMITVDTLVVKHIGDGQYRKFKQRKPDVCTKTMMDSDTEEEQEEDEEEDEDEDEDMKANVSAFRKLIGKK
ncbi:MAG: hypothetical protein EOO43_18695 [Flavobacterium sp.]|nr:MAG: hypothetical protein EOO43_18695 [Flavobacterium sp.]